jgi:hypothetical protein
MQRENKRIKLTLSDLSVESFDPLPAGQSVPSGTVRGYESVDPSDCQSCWDTACGPESCFPGNGGACGTFDTCAAQCASTIQMC